LPADDTDLENTFIWSEYNDVATDDDTYVQQCATDENTIFLFKDQHTNNTDAIQPYWKGKTSIAPSQSTVYLQVYNRITPGWETVDSDNATAADTEFVLQADIQTNLSDYYDASNWVAFRVYQMAE